MWKYNSLKFEEIPFMKDYGFALIRGKNKLLGWQRELFLKLFYSFTMNNEKNVWTHHFKIKDQLCKNRVSKIIFSWTVANHFSSLRVLNTKDLCKTNSGKYFLVTSKHVFPLFKVSPQLKGISSLKPLILRIFLQVN